MLALSLSVSFLFEEVGHHPSPFQEVPEASWIGCKNTNRHLWWTPMNQILGGCSALLGRWSRRRSAGDRCRSLSRRRAQTLSPWEGGRRRSYNACLHPRREPERSNIARIKCLQNCRIRASL